MRISNVKPAHVEWYIYTHSTAVPLMTITMTITLTLTLTLTITLTALYIRKDSTPIAGNTPYYIYKGNVAAGRYKINPRERFLLHHRCTWIQSCEVWSYRQVTFRKRPFETGRTTALGSRSIDVIYLPTHRLGQALLLMAGCDSTLSWRIQWRNIRVQR